MNITIFTHAPHARRGGKPVDDWKKFYTFTHAPHVRRGEAIKLSIAPVSDFYSRASCEARRRSLGKVIYPTFLCSTEARLS